MSIALSPPGEHFIVTEESFADVVYDKDGHPTGGFGHTGTWPDGTPLMVGQLVSRQQGIDWFRADVRHVLVALENKMDASGVELNQAQIDALVSLLFNCGTGYLESTHSLGLAFDKGSVDEIGKSILLYENATINGKHGPWLRGRRQAEYQTFNGAPSVLAAGVQIATVNAAATSQADT